MVIVTARSALASAGLWLFLAAQLTATDATPAITELLSWSLDYIETEAKSGETQSDQQEEVRATRECSCDGNACICCVNFNMSYVDLGGPGCVKLKYLSVADGLMVNVSYGDSVLHSQQVKVSKPEPACMEMLSGIVSVCARFTELVADGVGLRSCVVMEPTLLGYAQAHYPVGCFKMGPDGMTVDNEREPVISSGEDSQEEEDTSEEGDDESEGEEEGEEAGGSTDKPGLTDEAALIGLFNSAAEEGMSYFTSLLGIGLGGGGGNKNGTTPSPGTSAAPTPAPQRARSLNAI